MSLSKLSGSKKLLIGLAATGALSTAAFLYYLHRKNQRNQKSVDDQLSGAQRKKKLSKTASGSSNDGSTSTRASTIEAARSIDMEITIRKDDVAHLIGKGGQNVKKIQRDTDTRILPKQTLPNGDRIYTIVGVPSAVELAANRIKLHISSQPIITATELEVPDFVLGRLIGRNGDNIRQMQVVSGAKIDIPRTSPAEDYFESDTPQPAPNNQFRKIQVLGNDREKEMAIRLINDAVEEEINYRKRAGKGRDRRQKQTRFEDSGFQYNSSGLGVGNGGSEFDPISSDKLMEVFVSCVYQPNEFWIQVVGPDSIKLDKLCEEMTEYYTNAPEEEITQFTTGDIVAAPFDADSKMYRAKVLKFAEKDYVEIMFVDYGDKKKVHVDKIRQLNPEFLKLRFQAREATLNLDCPSEKWSDEIITKLVDLSFCAQWTPVAAKVIQVLKDPSDSHEKLWVELFTNSKQSARNIGQQLMKMAAQDIAVPHSESVEVVDTDNQENSTDQNHHAAHDHNTEEFGSGDGPHVIRRDSLVKNGISYATIASK